MFNRSLPLVYLSAFVMLFSSCRKREAVLPDTLVNFEVTSQGIEETAGSIEFRIQLTRGADRDIPVSINLGTVGVRYGIDFTTTPAATNNSINLVIPSGNNQAFFTVSKQPGVLFDGDEKLILDINSSGAPVIIGPRRQLTVTFNELVANNATLTINGGGTLFPNKVFIDLSANRQTPVLRTNWDLGFYMGDPNEFRVILNSSSAMMAKQLNKNDLTQVTSADTAGLTNEVSFSQFAPTTISLPYIDYPNGDLSRTAIAAISATATDNKVYIVNRGIGVGSPAPSRGWKKIRILRNASGGYTLQHADIASTTFQEIQVSRNDASFFQYVSFENGPVSVEPAKTKWDIAWTYFSNVTNLGGGEVPYLFQDIIIQNRNVQTVRILTSAKAFADFSEQDLTGLNFSSLQANIGADWRSGGGPGSGPAIRSDRYYIVRDGDNNYYKVRFTSLTQNGERGYPSYEAVLVKRG